MTNREPDNLPPDPAPRRLPRALIGAQAAAVLALLVWLVVLGRPIGWGLEWRMVARPFLYPPSNLLPMALVLTGFGALVGYLWRALRRERVPSHRRGLAWSIALALAVGAWCLQGASWMVVPTYLVELAAVQSSHVSTGYLEEAYTIGDLGRYLRDYARDMPTKVAHVATHPPGGVLLFYAVRRLGEVAPGFAAWALDLATAGSRLTVAEVRAAVMAYPGPTWKGQHALATAVITSYLLGALGCLTVLLVFAAMRAWLGDERALVAAALMALAPSLLMYFPMLDQLIALLGAVMLAAVAATPRHWAWGLVAGLAGAAAMFVSLGALALVAIAGLALLGRAALPGGPADQARERTRGGLTALGAMVAGLVLGLAAWYLIGVDTLGVLRTGLLQHSEIAGSTGYRTYHVWVWMNLVEFGIFLGLPAALGVVWAMPRIVADLRRKSGALMPAHLGAAALLVLLGLDLSGIVRGETSRIWLLFAPFLMPAAAGALMPDERHVRPFLIALALTALQLLAMSYALQPIVRPY